MSVTPGTQGESNREPFASRHAFLIMIGVMVAIGIAMYAITSSIILSALAPFLVPAVLLGTYLYAGESDRAYYGSTRDADGTYRWRGEN